MRSLVIGRSPHSDIVLADSTVERRHAEVVITDDGRYYLTDCATPSGTWRAVDLRDGEEIWERMRQDFVMPDQPLRLGGYRCTLGALLEKLPAQSEGRRGPFEGPERTSERLRGPVQRDPRTGEIVRKRP